ncbi:Putative type IV fimbrial biogenesis protein, involved in pilus assembly [gamma proteobacterium HdN1]|nr:Putative type IV fimbrial biogenesis protein, involved in pilus assembly [gamma proteobacterium HdN1]
MYQARLRVKVNALRGIAQGFSMIEVLITVLLISVGVLGMAGMQTRTIGYTQDSVQRSNAAGVAGELMEMIRANPEGLPGSSGFYKAAGTAFPSVPASCVATSVEASEQLACWAARAARVLPGVTSTLLSSSFYVCRSSAPGSCTNDAGSAVEIQVAWSAKAGECMDGNATGTTCTYRLRSEVALQ